MPKKLTYDYIKDFFANNNCILLEKQYINSKIKMKYQCICGNISEIDFNKFKVGRRCKKCSKDRVSSKLRLSYKDVKKYFKDNDCLLLEKQYINSHTKMKYQCNCGDISFITFDHFKNGRRCYKCGIKKNSGKNHGNYNHNLTDEERKQNRKTSEYNDWRLKVYKKDNYTCQKCLTPGKNLNAHHIESYAENKTLRTDADNGITLCQKCHNTFHSIYGKKGINRQHLNHFL